ncbi:ricin-type beta-trefoil lectin domain protein [Streptomyces sp. PSKA54]|uniref:Ricin-type beta-trefoil lectin domain protein n=1 Tax=Streptomyces himalayensis subsp. aureolus TaxID=2758039 RepID=A0A7W2HK15_9ACTN|nr:ricin-type beta-trefoil lectin domain protein [Streptomyces himalayensis]MBA4866683.1 ricin-type beta-trefoil lectin domain protein [Streptomyces himalayensis subsp. aureolus]
MNRKTAWAALAAVLSVLAVLVTPTSASADNPVVLTGFKNYGNTYCLDYYAARAQGDDLDVYTTGCNSGDFQKWYWNKTPGTATLMRQKQSNLCLTMWPNSGSYSVYMRPCDFETYGYMQRWYVAYPSGGGIPFIKNALHPDECLINGWQNSVGIWPCENGNGDMRWSVA